MRRLVLAVALCVTCAMTIGCSIVNDPGRHMGEPLDAGATMGTDAGTAPISAADFCSRLVAFYCGARIRCCSTAAAETVETCAAARIGSCQTKYGVYVTDGRTGYDPARAGVELAEGAALASTCNLDIVDWTLGPEGLLSVLRGTFAVGLGCAALDPTFLACQKPAVCHVQVIGSRCISPASSGQPCAADYECAEPLRCEPGGTCSVRVGDGLACQSDSDCDSRMCGATMTCATRTQDLVYCADPFARGFD